MTAGLVPHLSPDESARLTELESVVRSGLDTFVTVGRALAEIRDGRLYREMHGTFEAYCEEQWSLPRTRAYELISASEIAGRVSEISDIAPTREGQAKELRGLPTETAAAVMQKAHADSDGRVTAAAIREARQAIAPRPVNDPWASRIAAELAASDGAYAERADAASSPVDDYLATLPDDKAQGLADSGYLRAWAKAVHRAYEITQFDAERLGRLLDEDDAQVIYRFAATAERFADTVRRSRSGLRVINGGH